MDGGYQVLKVRTKSRIQKRGLFGVVPGAMGAKMIKLRELRQPW